MINENHSSGYDDFIRRIIEHAIESEIGQIDTLPPEVVLRVRDVYEAFMPAYVEIIRIKDNHPKDWQPQKVVPDPAVVEDMSHFFSDYQDLARRFKRVSRQAKNLLNINRQADPQRFERCVKEIVSGSDGSSIMRTLVGQKDEPSK